MENEKKERDKYENCVSLGWYCGCASSLSKLGLRSVSGPFDWYFSSYRSVLELIETEFVEFMNRENLEVDFINTNWKYAEKVI